MLGFIRELAEYERLLDQVEADEAAVDALLFSPNPRAFCDIAEVGGFPVGFALWFYNVSTFKGRCGLYLEDLYVRPEARGAGAGKALLAGLARRCVDEGLGRLEWAVLDWNTPAIAFYDSLDARQDGRLDRAPPDRRSARTPSAPEHSPQFNRPARSAIGVGLNGFREAGMKRRWALILGAVAALSAFGTASAQPAPDAAPQGTARSLQGDEGAWRNSPYMHQFYEAVVAACADGPANADIPALEAKSRAIFADFAVSMHMNPKALQDHLKDIPRQMVQIAKDDPKVLTGYGRFIVAAMGPE